MNQIVVILFCDLATLVSWLVLSLRLGTILRPRYYLVPILRFLCRHLWCSHLLLCLCLLLLLLLLHLKYSIRVKIISSLCPSSWTIGIKAASSLLLSAVAVITVAVATASMSVIVMVFIAAISVVREDSSSGLSLYDFKDDNMCWKDEGWRVYDSTAGSSNNSGNKKDTVVWAEKKVRKAKKSISLNSSQQQYKSTRGRRKLCNNSFHRSYTLYYIRLYSWLDCERSVLMVIKQQRSSHSFFYYRNNNATTTEKDVVQSFILVSIITTVSRQRYCCCWWRWWPSKLIVASIAAISIASQLRY